MVKLAPSTETKPGLQTTEFWVALFTNIIGLVNLSGGWNYVPNRWSVILMAVVNAAYAVSRGQAKAGVTPATNVTNVATTTEPTTLAKTPKAR